MREMPSPSTSHSSPIWTLKLEMNFFFFPEWKKSWKWNQIGGSLWKFCCWIKLFIYYSATALYKSMDVSEGRWYCPDLREPVGISQGCRWAVEMHVYIISPVPLAVTSPLMTNLPSLLSPGNRCFGGFLSWICLFSHLALMGSARTFKNKCLFKEYIKERSAWEKKKKKNVWYPQIPSWII